ncbi:MAG: sulfotransferase [Chromatiales bacterium]|nr:sulfotransferase [Chromatiales bacterium]
MAAWLAQHPQLELSKLKEPHYFSSDLNNREVDSKSEYDKLFSPQEGITKVLLDASTWYLYSKDAVPNILKEHPEARFIVMLRDPVEMAISLYFHNLVMGSENRSRIEDAWDLQTVRLRGRKIPWGCREPACLQYKAACSTGTLTERLLETVERSSVLLLSLSDLKKDPQGEFQRALAFLGLEPCSGIDFAVKNEARQAKMQALVPFLRRLGKLKKRMGIERAFGVQSMNLRAHPGKEVSPVFRRQLESAFAEERQILNRLLQSSPGAAATSGSA